MTAPTRRGLLIAAAGAGTLGTLSALGVGRLIAGADAGSPVLATSDAVARAEAARRSVGQRTVTARLVARPLTVDLGGVVVDTWAYGDTVPGPVIRATAGDQIRVVVDNRLETETSVHWHGLALRNDMDGVPGITQDPIAAGDRFTYEFTAPDPGTYFYHPHSGVQLDRGLHGVLVVDDPAEPGDHDAEWIVVLDDWVDGTGRSPDQVLEQLLAAAGEGGMDMGGMDHGSMGHGSMGMDGGMQSALLGGAGDVDYPHHLINGRTSEDPVTLAARPGQRVRVRIVNAGSDTAYRVALGGHRMTVTHSDGFPVRPVETDAVLIGMGERYDVLVTVGDGAFPLVASPEGKQGQGLAVVRTGAAEAPSSMSRPQELDRLVLTGTDLTGTDAVRLPSRSTDRTHRVALAGSMAPYRWTINGELFPDADPLPVSEGERVRLRFENHSMMFHPMHVHGHTFGLTRGGARKDTVIVRPMRAIEVDLDADNPGQWATHCHNIYHAEAGMMTTLSYRA
ncbi:multicopper oxidase family protein [Nocardioides dilutus]